MTSKSLFSALSKFQIKRKLWFIILCFVGWFLILPFITMLIVDSQIQDILANGARTLSDMQVKRLAGQVIDSNIYGEGLYGFLLGIMGIFAAIQAFMWNNDQKQVDLYRSVPVKEGMRFAVTYINGIFIYLISFGINLLFVNLVAAMLGVWVPLMIPATLYSLLLYLAVYLAAYSIALIAEFLTGNIIVAFCGTCVLLFIEPAVYLIRYIYCECFFKTYCSPLRSEAYFGGIFSPFTAYLKFFLNMIDSYYGSGQIRLISKTLPFVAILFIQAAVFTAIAYYIYKKRPPMTAGKTMLFEKTKPVIKAVIMIIASLLAGYVLADCGLSRPRAYGIIGIIISCLLLQLIIELIYERDIKKVLTGKISFAVALVLSLVIFCIFAFDITGYDRFIPKAESVKSIGVNIYGHALPGVYLDDDYNSYYNNSYYADKMALTSDASKSAVISTVTERIRLGDSDKIYEDGRIAPLEVTYKMKDGTTRSRLYDISYSMATDLYLKLYEDPEYRSAIHPIFSDGAVKLYKDHILPEGLVTDEYEFGPYKDYEDAIEYKKATTPFDPVFTLSYDTHTISGLGESHLCDDISDQEAFYDAICQDIMDREVKNVRNEVPIGYLRFYVRGDKNRSLYPIKEEVFESDERTMALIKEHGWADEDVMAGISKDDINGIDVNINKIADKDYTYGDIFGSSLCEEAGVDPSQIAFATGDYMGYYSRTFYKEHEEFDELLSNAIPAKDYDLFDPTVLSLTDDNITLSIMPGAYDFKIKKGELSDKIREATEHDVNMNYREDILENMGLYPEGEDSGYDTYTAY